MRCDIYLAYNYGPFCRSYKQIPSSDAAILHFKYD
jgi:hypothetical protein